MQHHHHHHHPQQNAPVDFDLDFSFGLDPSLFPPPPPLPSSADLFTPSETTGLFGFLDAFGWDIEEPQHYELPIHDAYIANNHSARQAPPYTNPHLQTAPAPSATAAAQSRTRSTPAVHTVSGNDASAGSLAMSNASPSSHAHFSPSAPFIMPHDQQQPMSSPAQAYMPAEEAAAASVRPMSQSQNSVRSVQPQPPPSELVLDHAEQDASGSGNSPPGTNAAQKQLLSGPQKRMNHILSEQRRRNAVRDGYAQLIGLLSQPPPPPHLQERTGRAPGSPRISLAMPTRGRPKGSGAKSRSGGQGKSGVLFRAVEYCKWLEEGRDALRTEVERVEEAARAAHGSSR